METAKENFQVIGRKSPVNGEYSLRITFAGIDCGPAEFPVGAPFEVIQCCAEQDLNEAYEWAKHADQSERIARLKAELAELEGNA